MAEPVEEEQDDDDEDELVLVLEVEPVNALLVVVVSGSTGDADEANSATVPRSCASLPIPSRVYSLLVYIAEAR